MARVGAARERVRAHRTGRQVYRIVVGAVGVVIIGIGIALLPLPGPGWVLIFVGLAVLASEFERAQRLQHYTRDKVRAWVHWLGRQPLPVRGLVGLGTLAIVAAALYLTMLITGVPDWLPDFASDWLAESVPGLGG